MQQNGLRSIQTRNDLAGDRAHVSGAPPVMPRVTAGPGCARGRDWGTYPLPLPHFFATPARGGKKPELFDKAQAKVTAQSPIDSIVSLDVDWAPPTRGWPQAASMWQRLREGRSRSGEVSRQVFFTSERVMIVSFHDEFSRRTGLARGPSLPIGLALLGELLPSSFQVACRRDADRFDARGRDSYTCSRISDTGSDYTQWTPDNSSNTRSRVTRSSFS